VFISYSLYLCASIFLSSSRSPFCSPSLVLPLSLSLVLEMVQTMVTLSSGFSPVFFVLRLRSGDESKAGNAGFLLFPFLSMSFRSSLSRYPWFVPFYSSLCFVLWSLSIYSLSIPLFIFLRPCSLRRNKENSFFGPPSLDTPGLFPSVLPSVLFYDLSLSIPLFIFLRPCSLRRNKENSFLFWFLPLRFLPFVAFSSPPGSVVPSPL